MVGYYVMAVLVTGASGFIGLNIVEALLNRGETAILFGPVSPPEKVLEVLSKLPGTFHVAAGDVRSSSDLDRVLEEFSPEGVIHAAAITPGTHAEITDPEPALEVNILGTMRLLEAVARHPVRRVVHLSSGAVYGANSFASALLDEQDTPPLPEALYAITKFAGERLALRFKGLFDIDLVVARIGAAFGPWESDSGYRETLSPMLEITAMARCGEAVVLDRPGRKDWIYSRDVAAAVLRMLDAPNPGCPVYNIGLGSEWAVSEWCAKLAKVYPDFSYAMAGDTTRPVNIDFYGPQDRSPLAVRRLADDLGFSAGFGLDQAFDDYLAWADLLDDINGK
jgi:nucleoside-diphosphate-sugar epimerase